MSVSQNQWSKTQHRSQPTATIKPEGPLEEPTTEWALGRHSAGFPYQLRCKRADDNFS